MLGFAILAEDHAPLVTQTAQSRLTPFLFLPPNPSLWQELNELMEYSAKFDIRPRTRFIVTSLVLGLFSFILSCIAEEEKYSK